MFAPQLLLTPQRPRVSRAQGRTSADAGPGHNQPRRSKFACSIKLASYSILRTKRNLKLNIIDRLKPYLCKLLLIRYWLRTGLGAFAKCATNCDYSPCPSIAVRLACWPLWTPAIRFVPLGVYCSPSAGALYQLRRPNAPNTTSGPPSPPPWLGATTMPPRRPCCASNPARPLQGRTLITSSPTRLEGAGRAPAQVEQALRASHAQVTNKGPGGR